MKKITQALKEKNLQISDLPENLKEEIKDLGEMVAKYNEACDEYESLDEKDRDEATEKQLDEMEDSISEIELEISEKINSIQTQQQTQPQTESKAQTKKDSSIGWLLFGGVALVVTLGVVNVFKKK